MGNANECCGERHQPVRYMYNEDEQEQPRLERKPSYILEMERERDLAKAKRQILVNTVYTSDENSDDKPGSTPLPVAHRRRKGSKGRKTPRGSVWDEVDTTTPDGKNQQLIKTMLLHFDKLSEIGKRRIIQSIQKGADINAKNKSSERFKNHRPIDIAVKSKNLRLVKIVLRFKPDLEGCSSDHELTAEEQKQTPLLMACKLDNVQIIQALLRAGANVDAVDANGMTCLGYALTSHSKNMLRIVEVLDEHYCKISPQEIATAEELAPEEVVKLLQKSFNQRSNHKPTGSVISYTPNNKKAA